MAERVQNIGIRDFEHQLQNSPHKVDLSTESGVQFSAIIVRNKDDANKKIMELHTRINTPIHVGDIINWQETIPLTSTEVVNNEKWILYRKLRKVNESYQTYYMVRCNYYLKWIDTEGHLQGSWCYFVSSLDSKIKENFRTWNSLITPQPNKYAEILMPTHSIMRHTNFIIEDEGWQMVESDFSSIAGVMYMSLVETKINKLSDDLVNDIANTDQLAVYTFKWPQNQTFALNSIVQPQVTLFKNNIVVEDSIKFSPYDNEFISVEFEAIKEGDTFIIVEAPNGAQELIPITIAQTTKQHEPYLLGDLTIKLDRSRRYELQNAHGAVVFSLDSDYAEIIEAQDNYCIVKANGENKLGYVTLTAQYANKTYTLQIKITPLW